MKNRLGIICWTVLLLARTTAPAAEIASNGQGGGMWSDPASWRGKKVPGAGDDVVIQKHDLITFDRNDDGKVTCRKLQIDPKGSLLFKKGLGKVICCVADEVESFGPIRLDGTGNAGDFLELRLIGGQAGKRKIKLKKGGALLVYGGPGHNVALTSPKNDKKEHVLGVVETEEMVMLDLRRARLIDVKLEVRKIDNTGAKANERMQVSDCRLEGQSRIWCHTCDSPVILRNTFDWPGAGQIPEPAISIAACPLAEVKDNTIRGNFAQGITLYANNEVVVAGNTVENCAIGIYNFYTLGSMIKNCATRDCKQGVSSYQSTALLENITITRASTALGNYHSTVQLATVEVKELDKKGLGILHEGGGMTLVNCNIKPAQVKVIVQKPAADPKAKPPPMPVTVYHYLVVGVKEAVPDTFVEVRTAKPALPADAADPNVRNSPAPVVKGLTPLPQTLLPLIVKGWTIDLKGTILPTPEYTVKVLGPATKEGAPRPVLKMQTFRPAENLFRAQPDEPSPTFEMSLKKIPNK